MPNREPGRRFWRLSAAGILFQGGAAAVDSSTVIASLIHGLTGYNLRGTAAQCIKAKGFLLGRPPGFGTMACSKCPAFHLTRTLASASKTNPTSGDFLAGDKI